MKTLLIALFLSIPALNALADLRFPIPGPITYNSPVQYLDLQAGSRVKLAAGTTTEVTCTGSAYPNPQPNVISTTCFCLNEGGAKMKIISLLSDGNSRTTMVDYGTSLKNCEDAKTRTPICN
jgi:hypothetical protein